MNPIRSGAAAAAAVLILLSANSATLAHGWAGQRFFPATILTDDPFVADEMSLPQISVNPHGPDGSRETFPGGPAGRLVTLQQGKGNRAGR